MRPAAALAALLSSAPGALATYTLVREYSGSSFFTGWDFYGNYDNLTNGDVTWVTQANATQSKLSYVDDAGHAIIKVDNTTFVPYNYKRDSVRITSTDYFSVGSVFVFDANHLPYGCSVWPSFWTKGQNWPIGGEIDIIEAVNRMTYNQMALHTQDGCTQPSSVTQSGTTGSTNCTQDAGCTVAENQSNSYGDNFANAGGGVWAAQLDVSGIFIWFWTRASVPSSVSGAKKSIDTSSWGTPSAAYPSSSCNITEFFTPQQLVIDITLCGDWAGGASVYESTCGGDGSATACYINNVINNGSNYADAYFSINYVKVFSLTDGVLVPSASGGSTVLVTESASDATSEPSASSTTGSQSGNKAATLGANAYVAVAGATVLAAVSWILL
ncbi:concanavalin A-like lectin/glucanase domain-containing protein [Dichomitus squalens]|uniref:Concanavalin A-like lectin/glucanase domain-containing protein n=1 Tax=Dichomitus squalens TaxID=114155 RepID=A0A4Q9MWH4_9APHY|nr:concanavalin A-like lectin/glucanase domain-containing protein [Dichomitus squalens]